MTQKEILECKNAALKNAAFALESVIMLVNLPHDTKNELVLYLNQVKKAEAL